MNNKIGILNLNIKNKQLTKFVTLVQQHTNLQITQQYKLT